ncbi:Uncharacterised protein [uncultured archaeon]|nr:Uncharacterised protein [uncultured archaeon]
MLTVVVLPVEPAPQGVLTKLKVRLLAPAPMLRPVALTRT